MARRPAKADASDEIPSGYERRFLKCRALGHSWLHSTDVVTNPTMSWVRGLSSVCSGCGTVRTRWLSRDGTRWGMSYTYPDGYQMKRTSTNGDLPRPAPPAQEWRREFISHLPFPEQAAPLRQPASRRR
jgi:hypothetical protein